MQASPALTIEFTSAHQRITYTDAVSFAVMKAARCTAAMSFDHDFVVAGFRLWQPR
ncbi:MAG TPA: hypothetical protein VMW56_21005 [Candidatus Margulisiibacteriota bacterium]|nr:hypothetical protein [Candidatus Margulisiibacteriota bacterium]